MFAEIFLYVYLSVIWATVILWFAAILWTQHQLKVLSPLCFNDFLEQKQEPSVSVLLPARNEEKRILAKCVSSLLAQNYENFQIIAVNDRSIDKTGEILHEFAKGDSKLRVIEGTELPARWLGKPFVLQQALAQAKGEWVVSTDADVVFAPEALRSAISYAERNSFDALCLIPFDTCGSFWEAIFLPTFSWFRMLKMPPSRVNNPQHSASMGVGNFFLIRRTALQKIGGFESVKTEVAEDLRLAELLKQSGARFRLDYAPDLLQTRMYAGFREIWTGFTKNLFAGANFSLLNIIFGAVSIAMFGVLPVILAFFCFAAWLFTKQILFFWLLVPAILIYICQTIVFAVLYKAWSKPLGYAFFAPLGMALFGTILLNSAIKVLTGRGVIWKGRAIYKRSGANLQPPVLEKE
ncbi:MAG: glycosyltransferase family 2 protein [Pyrinomonadaceae bacterium]